MTFEELLTTLRATYLGKFYRAYLKKIPAVHWMTRRLWNVMVWGYGLHTRVVGRPQPFIGLNDLVSPPDPVPPPKHTLVPKPGALARIGNIRKNLNAVIPLAAPETIETPPPLIFPEAAKRSVTAPHERYLFPAITALTLNDAIAHGASNFITMGETVVHHDLYDFKRDLTAEEMHGRCVIEPRRQIIRWSRPDTAMEPLALAANFIDGTAANYAHWLTEVLPRVAMFCTHVPFQGIPMLVNDGLHANLMESLRLVAGDRPMICVPLGHCVRAEKLIVVSPTGYVPFDHRTRKVKNPSQGIFSAQALLTLQRQLTATVTKTSIASRKIYVRRNSANRAITNHQELEALVLAQGFTIVEPEKLSFAEQVALFHQAEVIVGQGGAGLANLIFCKPGTRIVIMSIDSPGAAHWYWQNMARATGNSTRFVLGPMRDTSHLHTDFSIPADALDAAINA